MFDRLVRQVVGSTPMGQMMGYAASNMGKGLNVPSEEEKRRNALIGQQRRAIASFERERPEKEREAIRQVQSATKQALQDRLRGERTSYADRGLLFSGIRQQGEAQLKGQAAGQMAQQSEAIKRSFMTAKNRLDELYNKMRFGAAEQAVMDADAAYDLALADAQGTLGGIGAMGGALGAAVGGYIGGRK